MHISEGLGYLHVVLNNWSRLAPCCLTFEAADVGSKNLLGDVDVVDSHRIVGNAIHVDDSLEILE